MKKKGSALVTVLVIFTALIIIATAISSAVINTNKLNKRYSENIDLELAAKSAVNMIKEDFISRINTKKIKTLEDVEKYVENINNNIVSEEVNYLNSFLDIYSKDDIFLDVLLDISEKDKFIITTYAKNENKNIKKEENAVLILKFTSNNTGGVEVEEDECVVNPVNFLNIKSNLQIQNCSQDLEEISKYISLGGNLNFNNQDVNKDQSYEMKNLNLLISNPYLDKEINESIYINTQISDDVIDEEKLKNENVEYIKNKNIIQIENKNIKINSSVDIDSDKTIIMKNSILKIDGNLNMYTGNTLNIELENSKLIIMGKIYSANTININLKSNSTIYINNDLEAVKELNININNSKLISRSGSLVTAGNFTLNAEENSNIYVDYRLFGENKVNISLNKSKIVVKNGVLESNGKLGVDCDVSSIIYIKSRFFGGNGVEINLNSSKLVVESGALETNGECIINSKQNSVIYTNTRLYAAKTINMNTNNSKLIVQNGALESNGEFNLITNNNSEIIVGKTLNGANKVNINSNDSNIILGVNQIDLNQEALKSSGNIILNSLNSSYIISGIINCGNGLIAELNNTALICNANINLYSGNSIITNMDKSFLLLVGNTNNYISNLQLKSMSENFTPDNSNVIATINKYISKVQ